MWCFAVSEQAIPAYVVNLARAQDRRALMSALFQARGLRVEWIAAVDARSPVGNEAELLAAMPSWGPWGEVHGHAKGCTLSHFKAFEALVASGASHGLILEDDVFLAEDIADWLASTDWIPADADVVKLERWRDDRLLVLMGPVVKRCFGRDLHPLYSKHTGAAAYIISANAASKVLMSGFPDVPIDHVLFNPNISQTAQSLSVLQVMPALATQGNEPRRSPEAATPFYEFPMTRFLKMKKALQRLWAELSPIPTYVGRILMRRARFYRIDFKVLP